MTNNVKNAVNLAVQGMLKKGNDVIHFDSMIALTKIEDTLLLSELTSQVKEYSKKVDLYNLEETSLIADLDFVRNVAMAVVEEDNAYLHSLVDSVDPEVKSGFAETSTTLLIVLAVLKNSLKL